MKSLAIDGIRTRALSLRSLMRNLYTTETTELINWGFNVMVRNINKQSQTRGPHFF